jgi:hypothetical protein
MATWPANGDTDWNTKMLAYLAVEHNADGTHDMHNAEGGYMQVDVDAVKTNVYTKYLTGNLDADSETSVAHGCTAAKILHVSVIAYQDDVSVYRVNEIFEDASAADEANYRINITYDATNIIMSGVGAKLQGNAYRIRIDYYL